jgi:UDP-N-acetylglucosamine enolpyruvyl transferase
MVYIAPIGSKHESESLFQKLTTNIVEVQTLRGIVLLGGDFNACTATLLDTIHTNDLYELLQVPELVEIEQPGAMAKRQIATLVLVVGATSSWTYAMTLSCSSSMTGRLVTNQGSSLA